MKQTNNAIKFLMAQYRAIFKNANIAMVAAIAAAALAAGQAQAAPLNTTDQWTGLKGNELTAGGSSDSFETITLVATDKANPHVNSNEFTLTIKEDAAHAIDGTTDNKGGFTAESGSLVIAGSGDVGATALTVGGKNTTALKLKDVNITKGTLTVKSGSLTTVGENGIVLGDASKLATADDSSSIVTDKIELQKGSTLTLGGGKVESANINLASGSSATITKGNLGKSGATISLVEGVTLTGDGANADEAKVLSNVTVSGGTLTTAAKKLTLDGSLTVESGVFKTEASGEAKVNGVANINGSKTFDNAGSSLFSKNVEFAAGSIKSNAGTIQINAAAGDTTTLTVAASDYATVFSGKVGVSGADATSKLVLNFVGDDAIDLNTIVSGDASAGGLKDKISKDNLNGAGFTISASNVEFAEGAKLAVGAADLNFGSLTAGKSGAFQIAGGKVTINNAIEVTASGDTSALTIADTGSLTLDAKGQSGSITAKTVEVNAANKGDKALNIKGTWGTAANITVTKGVVSLNDATLNLTGKLAAADSANGTVVADNSTINAVGDGNFALSGNALTLKNNARLELDKLDLLKDQSGKLVLDDSKFAQDSVIGGGNTTIALMDGKNKVSMKVADFEALKTAFGTKFTGLFEVELSDILEGDSKPVEGMSLDKVVSNASTTAYNNTGVTVDDGANAVDVSASVGNVHVKTEHDLTLDAGGALTLNKANAKGQFVSKKSGDSTTLSNVTFKSEDNALVLGGTGEIGAIKTDSGVKGSFTVGTASAKGTVTVKGDVGASASEIKTVTVQKDNNLVVNGSVFTQALGVGENGSIDVGSSGNITTQSAKISGDVTANTLTISGGGTTAAPQANDFNGNSTIDVSKLVLGANNTLDIGKDKVGQDAGSFAHVYADTFVFDKTASVYVDPEYGGPASLLAVQNITDDASKMDVQTLGGKAYIGKNAAMGIGFTDAEFGDLMADYLTVNGGFNENGDVKNALALNAPITIADGSGIVINSEAERAALDTAFKGNQVTMEGKSALILTDKAFGEKKDKAAITFESTSAGSIAVTGTDSKVVLVGDFDGTDQALKLAVYNTNNIATVSQGLKIEYAGGLLLGDKNQDGTYKLVFQQDKAGAIYDGVSRPVADAIVAKLKGQFKDKNAAGYGLLSNLIATQNYKAIDAAAHAATYAGAQQAAVAAVTTMADAMFGRVGAVGVEAASISATGSQANGGVWLTPMYKSVDSDGFSAEGASYGADVDLSGVAFGTDTVNGNMRFGAVFNIGSGDAEGKGNGNGLKDEFDYYGFGIYSAMGFGNFALVGDASMTVISHEVEGLGLRGKADTTAVTMGVTGQYTVATPVVDVTPHLGARFIRLNTDSYDLISANGVEGTTDFDVQNVFSVPLGVTLSKGFTTGGWTLAPSADLTIAFNTGDTEAKSNTFTAGKNIGLNTEVLDEVQYGVTLGLGAQYGAFGTSFGINYTGSSNTDSFGVNAQARYMF